MNYPEQAIYLSKQLSATLLALVLTCPTMAETTTQYEIELHQSRSGTYTLSASTGVEIEAEFLLDTGASMVMISSKLFKQISQQQKLVATGKIAAAMASGRMKTIPTYHLPSLVLGKGCDVGPLEVAVVRGATRNLIGLNALSRLGRLTLDIQAGTLSASECPHRLVDTAKVAALVN